MIDVERKVRKVSRAIGVEVSIVWAWRGRSKRPSYLVCNDTELDGKNFTQAFDVPSSYERTIHQFHEWIYRERAKKRYELQNGLCANCGRFLKDQCQTDHIVSRGAHGRDDRLENLQVFCAPFTGGCSFHEDKHTKGKNGSNRIGNN